MSDSGPTAVELLDTCVIARYLVGDAPDQMTRAAALIESDRPLCVSLTVVAEVGFLLTRFYAIDRTQVVAALAGLLNRANVEVLEVPTEVVEEALQLCSPSGRVSFADAMLWAQARHLGATVLTFDRRFPSDGVQILTP